MTKRLTEKVKKAMAAAGNNRHDITIHHYGHDYNIVFIESWESGKPVWTDSARVYRYNPYGIINTYIGEVNAE